MDMIDRLLEHDRWATSHLLGLCQDLTDNQLDQEFDIGLRTIRQTFDHQVHNIVFWTAQMAGHPLTAEYDAERAQRTVPQLIQRHNRAYDEFASLARRLRDEGRLEETFEDHFGMPPSFGGTIIHVTLHNEWHRSEIVHMLTRIGVHEEPPEVDHLLWEHVVNGRTTA
jgi:uncharacterized damage-inducible protein DinB